MIFQTHLNLLSHLKDIDLCIIPPFPIIKEAKHIFQETEINVGAQMLSL